MKYIYLFIIPVLLSCGKTSKTNNAKDFVGTWKSSDSMNIQFQIKEKMNGNKPVEERYMLTILQPENSKRVYGIINNQFNYKLVKSEENRFPFKEFLYENTMRDSINFFSLKHHDTLIRKYTGIEDQIFIRTK